MIIRAITANKRLYQNFDELCSNQSSMTEKKVAKKWKQTNTAGFQSQI